MNLCRLRARLCVALCLSLIAVSAFAQFQTGNIYGQVVAKDGSALPGVTVTLTGVGAPQTIITDPQGDFHFLNLSPGTYAIKSELAGFGTASRTGIGVRVGANADVTLTLNPSVTESIPARRRCSTSARPEQRSTCQRSSWKRCRHHATRGRSCSRLPAFSSIA